MSSGTPWWSPILAIVVTLAGTYANEERRRRHERHKLSDPRKMDAYLDAWNASTLLLKAAVWPADPLGKQDPVTPMADDIGPYVRASVYLGPAPVGDAAFELAEAAEAFARTVEEIRRADVRGVGGAVPETAQGGLTQARDRLTAAVADFARLTRADLTISGARTPRWWSRGPR